jgi:hypothetical protein
MRWHLPLVASFAVVAVAGCDEQPLEPEQDLAAALGQPGPPVGIPPNGKGPSADKRPDALQRILVTFSINTPAAELHYLSPKDGRFSTTLPTNLSYVYATYGPDGRIVAYAHDFAQSLFETWILAGDGEPLEKIDLGPYSLAFEPAWSPLGDEIAVVSEGPGLGILVQNLSTGAQRFLDGAPFGTARRPEWSPDGAFIAFDTGQSGPTSVYVASADFSEIELLVDECRSPEWSPDGLTIACVEAADGSTSQTFKIVNVLTGAVEVFETNGTPIRYIADWSPDGTRLTYLGFGEDVGGTVFEVVVMNADGSNAETIFSSSSSFFSLSWR